MKINLKKGFTLIELLVVVAIIGILASVVIASLNKSRDKGEDAAVKSNLRNAIAQGEIIFGTRTTNKDSYKDICAVGVMSGETTIKGIGDFVLTAAKAVGLSSVNSAVGTAGTYNTATCHVDTNGTAWAAEVPLSGSVSGASVMWCVDNLGHSQQQSNLNLGANIIACS